MYPSEKWIAHFTFNAQQQRINWQQVPQLLPSERNTILRSMQAWQLGETSDGSNLVRAAKKYAAKGEDPYYVAAIELFIKEEQKHGNNLGKYLDAIGEKRIKLDWGDTLFRKVRHFNTSMEIWTVTVIVVESTAQIYYQALKDASNCQLLKQICTDILIDEAYHIRFQAERLADLFHRKSDHYRAVSAVLYKAFFFATATVVWLGHRRLFKAGGNTFKGYLRKMHYKYIKIFQQSMQINYNSPTYQAFFHSGN